MVHFAPVYNFGSKEIVAWSTSTSPSMSQQAALLDRLLERMPEGATPVLHSDMGWQYQHAACQASSPDGHDLLFDY